MLKDILDRVTQGLTFPDYSPAFLKTISHEQITADSVIILGVEGSKSRGLEF